MNLLVDKFRSVQALLLPYHGDMRSEGWILARRWNAWMVFDCSNIDSHPDDSQVGGAILTNGAYAFQVTNAISEKVCSVCGEQFQEAFAETALTLFLQHDIERFKRLKYNVVKDEEVLWK